MRTYEKPVIEYYWMAAFGERRASEFILDQASSVALRPA